MNAEDLAPDFELLDLLGQPHRLSDHRGSIVILNFWSCECPHSARTDELVLSWQQHWGARVALLPIASNANESIEAIAAAASSRALPMVLLDPGHAIADLYAAQTTPHVFVLDLDGRIRYRGAVDDVSFARRSPLRFFLAEAVQALLTGDQPSILETPPFGCAIIREALE